MWKLEKRIRFLIGLTCDLLDQNNKLNFTTVTLDLHLTSTCVTITVRTCARLTS